MATKKDLVIAVLVTFCLTATLFIVLPSRSVEPYSPWADVSGPTVGESDGTINMRDINYEILRFNTFGDTTKNVSVTNWPAKRTLNASLADNWLIDGSQAWQLEADVIGYSKVTLLLRIETSAEMADVAVYFIIGGVWTTPVYRNYTLTSGTYFLLQNYELIGPTIHLEFQPSGTIRVWVGIYATD
jgi:hypothetical protein